MPGAGSGAATVVHPRLPPRRRTTRADQWWGKAWVRAVEESAYAEADLVAGRSLARSGRVGAIEVGPGSAVAVVEDRDRLWRAEVAVPVLDDAGADALVETVAARAGRVTALLAGDLPHELVEHAEEAGVELLPYGGELATSCACAAWVDPCAHALALLHQLTWLLEADPFVLLHLRGTGREELLARLHARAPAVGGAVEAEADDDDLTTAYDAAARAARLLEVLQGDGPPDIDHLL